MEEDRIRRLEHQPTADSIADSIRRDIASRNADIVAFMEMLDATDGPYTYFVDAPWGEGKTFFIRSVELVMRATNVLLECEIEPEDERISAVTNEVDKLETTFLPLYFNAWENDDYGDPIGAIFATLAAQLGQEFLTKTPKLDKGITSVVDLAIEAFSPIKASVSGIADVMKGTDLIECYRSRSDLRSRINDMASKANLEVADKLVIFIDELDRCRPDYAVRLLEQTKSMFQSENVVVVLSADSVQLANAMAGVYGSEYASPHFMERFYDRRIGLAKADPYALATGNPFQETSYRFDSLVSELLNNRVLTARDIMRLYPKLHEARVYANFNSGNDYAFDTLLTKLVAKCVFLPILVFMDRENPALFREVVSGQNYDAVYEYGKGLETFNDTIQEAIGRGRRPAKEENTPEVTEQDVKQYCHDLCIAIYAPTRNSKASIEARHRLGIVIQQFSPVIYRELRFPRSSQQG
jgi:hypothetical protein